PLGREAARGEVTGGDLGPVQRVGDARLDVEPDLGRIVLHPARAGIELLVLPLVHRHHPGLLIEDHAAGGRGSLIDGGDETHADSLCRGPGPVMRTRPSCRGSGWYWHRAG